MSNLVSATSALIESLGKTTVMTYSPRAQIDLVSSTVQEPWATPLRQYLVRTQCSVSSKMLTCFAHLASAESTYLPSIREILGLPPRANPVPSTSIDAASETTRNSAEQPPTTQPTTKASTQPSTAIVGIVTVGQKAPDSQVSNTSTSSSSSDGTSKMRQHLAQFAYSRPTHTASYSTLASSRTTPASRSASTVSLNQQVLSVSHFLTALYAVIS